MVSNQIDLAERLRSRTHELKKEKTKLQAQIREIDLRMDQIDRDLAAYEMVIAREDGSPLPITGDVTLSSPRTSEDMTSLLSTKLRPVMQETIDAHDDHSLSYWRRKLENLSILEALVVIATENDGVVRISSAIPILLKAEVSESTSRNLSSYIYKALGDSDLFEKAGKGRFRLTSREGR